MVLKSNTLSTEPEHIEVRTKEKLRVSKFNPVLSKAPLNKDTFMGEVA